MGTFLRFRPKPRRYPREIIITNPDTTYLQPTLAVLFGIRGGARLGGAAFTDTTKTSVNAAVAAGATVTFWTPAGGNVVELTYLSLYTSVAGALQLIVNGVAQMNMPSPAQVTTIFYNQWPGLFCYPASSALGIKNNTAGAMDIYINAMGTEVAN